MNRAHRIALGVIVVAFATGAGAQEITNAHFDADLTGWSVALAPRHQWSPVDSGDAVGSGSLLALKDIAGGGLVRATQCVAVEPGMTIQLMVWALVLDSGDPADITIDLTPHSDGSCQTPTGLNRVIETPPQDVWTRIVNGPHVVPEGVQSVQVGLGLYEAWQSTMPVSAHFDDVEFFLFLDGFEAGTCSQWSSARPFCGTPEVGLRVEMTWETTGDPDPGDEVGSDLDLHLLHPDAAGEWLGAFDCYQANTHPDWGAAGITQDAILILEDNDGGGPEVIQIYDPESFDYDIGVHFVDDLGYGVSDATVTIFIDGSSVYEYPAKALYDGEFWHLGSVAWPSGTVTLVDSVTAGVPD